MLLWTPFVPSLCPVCKEIGVDVCDGRDPSQQTMSRVKRGFFLLSLRSLLVRCKFTWPFNSLSTQAVEFCSAASVRAYKEALLPGSQRRAAKFRSLRKKAFLAGSVSWQIMWKDTRPQQQQHAGIYFCLSSERTQNTYLRKKMSLMFAQLYTGLS